MVVLRRDRVVVVFLVLASSGTRERVMPVAPASTADFPFLK